MAEILRMCDVDKDYTMAGQPVPALRSVNFHVDSGEFVSILGPSGSGKSTMMNIIGCLDTPTAGTYALSGKDVGGMSEAELAHVRNREIGFVFQSFQLLPRLSAFQNVELPLIYGGVPPAERRRRTADILERVGLSDKFKNRPSQLSGGQQQRVAIARAVVTEPTILLADEPTGALDQTTGAQVMDLFARLNGEGRTILMITHDPAIARRARRVVTILDGRLSEGVAGC